MATALAVARGDLRQSIIPRARARECVCMCVRRWCTCGRAVLLRVRPTDERDRGIVPVTLRTTVR